MTSYSANDFLWKVNPELQHTGEGWRRAGWLALCATNPEGARRIVNARSQADAAWMLLPLKTRRRINDDHRRRDRRVYFARATEAMRDFHDLQEDRYRYGYVTFLPRIDFQVRNEVLRDFRSYLFDVKARMRALKTTRQETQA